MACKIDFVPLVNSQLPKHRVFASYQMDPKHLKIMHLIEFSYEGRELIKRCFSSKLSRNRLLV